MTDDTKQNDDVEWALAGPPSRMMTARERYQHLWIAKMRRSQYFWPIVKKLVAGKQVRQVAQWLSEQPDLGEFANCSAETLRKYLTAVNIRVQENLKGVDRVDMKPLEYRAVVERMEQQTSELVDQNVDLPAGAEEIHKMVTKAVKELDSETMLKYCFLVQQGRVQRMLKMEESLGMLWPDGHKNLAVLAEIASEVRRLEVSERSIGNGKTIGPYPGALLPVPAAPRVGRESVSRLSDVDRNLVRVASQKVVDMLEAEVGVGGEYSFRAGPVSGGSEAGASEGDKRSDSAEVAPGV